MEYFSNISADFKPTTLLKKRLRNSCFTTNTIFTEHLLWLLLVIPVKLNQMTLTRTALARKKLVAIQSNGIE